MKSRSPAVAAVASLVLAGSLAGCGDLGQPAGSDLPSGAAPSVTESASSSRAALVATAESELGTILVDSAGMTLYVFTNDTPGSGQSVCEGQCLAAWPPLVGPAEAGTGADPALLGALTRSDGATQVTYNGWPLYYWAGDTAAGETTGQGVNGVWWVVSPQGAAIGAE